MRHYKALEAVCHNLSPGLVGPRDPRFFSAWALEGLKRPFKGTYKVLGGPYRAFKDSIRPFEGLIRTLKGLKDPSIASNGTLRAL